MARLRRLNSTASFSLRVTSERLCSCTRSALAVNRFSGFNALPLTKYATAPPITVTASAMYQPVMQKLCLTPVSSTTNSPAKRWDTSFHCSSGISMRMDWGSSSA